MWRFRGNLQSGEVDSQRQNLPMVINAFSLVNRSSGVISVNVYMIEGNAQIEVMPNVYQIVQGQMYESQRPIVMLPTENIRLTSTGSVDYDFSISNLKTDDPQLP